MPAPRKPRLIHVPVRLRVSVNTERWQELYGPEVDLETAVRQYVVQVIHESDARREGAIAGARRDSR